MFKKVWNFIIEKKVLHDLGAIFIILAVLICASFFCNCAAPEIPDTTKTEQTAKETLAKVDKLEKSGAWDPGGLLEAIAELKQSVKDLLEAVKLQKTYVAYAVKKIEDLKNSIEYTIGSYVVWIGIVICVIVGLYIALRIYAAYGTPTGIAATILSKFFK
jgi:hypothetical protein